MHHPPTRRRPRVKPAPAAVLLAALAAACAPDAQQPPRVAAGATLILEKPVKVPAETREIWFQKGERITYRRSRLRPYCRLRVNGDTGAARTVAPGRFEIAWVREDWQAAGVDPLACVKLARLGLAEGDAGSDPLSVSNELVMGLASPDRPRVTRLICGKHRPTGPHFPPTLKEIDTALGSYGRLATLR